MAYTISRARRNLETSFDAIAETLRKVDMNATEPAIRDYVIAAGIMLAHAEVENYISDLIDAFAAALTSPARRCSELPPLLQSHLFIEKSALKTIVGNLLTGRSEREALNGFQRVIAGPVGSIVNGAVPLTTIRGTDIYTVYKYPSKDNIKKLLQRLGVADPEAQLNRIIKADAISLLDSLGGLRTQLAHTGGTLPGVTPKDVRDRLKGVTKFIRAFDGVVYNLTHSHFGAVSWQAIAT